MFRDEAEEEQTQTSLQISVRSVEDSAAYAGRIRGDSKHSNRAPR